MERFDGTDLGESPHICILGSAKVGNFVVTIPLLRLLRNRYPNSIIDFWGSEITKDFESALCSSDQPLSWRTSWDLKSSHLDFINNIFNKRIDKAGPVDLVLNCDGFNPYTISLARLFNPRFIAGCSLRSDYRSNLEWGNLPNQRFLSHNNWDAEEFLQEYNDLFHTNYIAELICRMAFLEPTLDDIYNIKLPFQDPGIPIPELLIHCTTSRRAKIWPYESWDEVLSYCCRKKINVGLVGLAPEKQVRDYYSGEGEEYLLKKYTNTLIDMRGKTNLLQLAGACRKAKAMISVDAGPMHIAVGVGTKTLAIVGNDSRGYGVSPIRLWLPRSSLLDRTTSDFTSTYFSDNHYKNDDDDIALLCMRGVRSEQVINWISQNF